jgi:hypothetical protein
MRPPRKNKAVKYRQQAAEIRTIARQIPILETRFQLLDAAKHLETLAEKAERRAREADAAPSPIQGLDPVPSRAKLRLVPRD